MCVAVGMRSGLSVKRVVYVMADEADRFVKQDGVEGARREEKERNGSLKTITHQRSSGGKTYNIGSRCHFSL